MPLITDPPRKGSTKFIKGVLHQVFHFAKIERQYFRINENIFGYVINTKKIVVVPPGDESE